jgi:hypothetical protein
VTFCTARSEIFAMMAQVRDPAMRPPSRPDSG